MTEPPNEAGEFDETVAATIRTAVDEWRIHNDPADMHGVSMPEYVRRALADAGLLVDRAEVERLRRDLAEESDRAEHLDGTVRAYQADYIPELSGLLRGMARRAVQRRKQEQREFSAKQRHFQKYNDLLRLMASGAGFTSISVTPDKILESMLRRRADIVALRIERDEALSALGRQQALVDDIHGKIGEVALSDMTEPGSCIRRECPRPKGPIGVCLGHSCGDQVPETEIVCRMLKGHAGFWHDSGAKSWLVDAEGQGVPSGPVDNHFHWDCPDMNSCPLHAPAVFGEAGTSEASAESDEFAMKLRPQLQANSKLEQNLDEGLRPSGSEAAEPRPVESEASALVREFHEAFDLPINDATRTLNKLRADLVREEAREAGDAIEAGPPEAIAKELADVVIVTHGAAQTFGIDLDEAIRLVHASNMSKLGHDGKPVMRSDGKVLKGPNYQSPDMTSALRLVAASAERSEATRPDVRTLGEWCDRCGTHVTGSHYHCAKCGQRSGMLGHSMRPCPTPAVAATDAEPSVSVRYEPGIELGEDGRGRRLHIDPDPNFVAQPMDPSDIVEPSVSGEADTSPRPRVWAPGSPAPDGSVTKVIGENDVTFERTNRDLWHAKPPEGNGRDYAWAWVNEHLTVTEVLPGRGQQ